jgi:putative endonuclease
MFTVYAFKSKIKNYIYVGMTQNLGNRIRRHNNGFEKTTKPYKPFELIYSESYQTRTEAR